MPLSRALKNRVRGGNTSAERAPGQPGVDGNSVGNRSGRERPDAPKDTPGDTLDTKARIIKTND